MPSKKWDERRKVAIVGDKEETLLYATKHFIECASHAIEDHGKFFVALSGGSTPKAIYKMLSENYQKAIDWSKVFVFFSDERSVISTSEDSNYYMALHNGIEKLPIPKNQIYRMVAEIHIHENAIAYEQLIEKVLEGRPFDLIMLGMGEDGHTASLFPETEALSEMDREVAANFIPEKKTWRMTFTYLCINKAKNIAFYVLGEEKKYRLENLFLEKDPSKMLPAAKVGSKTSPALWIVDEAAGALLRNHLR